MYLKCHRRIKDSKEHRYWSIAEKRRVSRGRVVDRHVLYLGEINDSQREAWLKSIEAFDESRQEQRRLALFPSDQAIPEHARGFGVRVRLSEFRLQRPRQWGACWTFMKLSEQLQLDEFWRARLLDSREGTSWYHVLMVLTAYRLIDPGSEWRLHREWYARSAMGDLLEEDDALAAKDTLYRCLDKLLEHKEALFGFLKQRWQDLFGVKFDVLLYDLTSTYFESDPPFPEEDKRRYGYSRDHRSDCVQVVIALIVTPEGFPLTYEVMAGNTADSTTLPGFLERIEARYGQAQRVWVMDRGIPTEKHLTEMRHRGASYLVGTPKGRLSKLERELATKPWQEARPEVKVKLLPQEGELYVFVQSLVRLRRHGLQREHLLPGPRTDGHPIGDRVPEQIVHRAARRRVEGEVAILAIAHEQSLAFERPADALGDPLDERLQLARARRGDAPKHRRVRSGEVRAVEHQHVEVDVGIERRPESLNERHGARVAGRARQTGLLEDVSGNPAIDDAEHLREHVGVGGQQKPQGEGQGKNPLAQRPCGEHFIDQERRSFRHPPRAAARAKAAPLTAERDELLGVARFAFDPKKTVLEAPAFAIRLELLLHVLWQQPAGRLPRGEKRRIVLLDDLIEQRLFRAVLHVARRIDERRRAPRPRTVAWHPLASLRSTMAPKLRAATRTASLRFPARRLNSLVPRAAPSNGALETRCPLS